MYIVSWYVAIVLKYIRNIIIDCPFPSNILGIKGIDIFQTS